MLDFSVHAAVEGDLPKIRDLLMRVSSCPSSLDWRRFIVAENTNGVCIGCGQIRSHFDGTPELASLAVDTPYRRQGVARAIIERLLANWPRPLYTTCRTGLGPLYEKFGFRTIGFARMPLGFKCEFALLYIATGIVQLVSPLLKAEKSAKARKVAGLIRHGGLVMRLD